MRQKRKIILAAFAILFVCSFMLTAQKAEAASVQWPDHTVQEEKRIVTETDTMAALYDYMIDDYSYETGTTFKVSNVKSSNKKVAKVTWDGEYASVIPTGKTGTAKITYKLTDPETKQSKTFTLVKCTYVKYKNPFSSFKVGSKNLTKSVNNYDEMSAPYFGTSSKKKKLSIKTASGYKVLSIKYNGKKLKNGKSYKFNKSGEIQVEIQHKKTKATGIVYIFVD